ncbi:MAG: biotin--[acetyl-CoA-carboxylase] ligase [Gallionellaceae bacterium]|nr:biotin--[acetyl-CoA-carboxylase] ligase [Gallionellaceae bacterium]
MKTPIDNAQQDGPAALTFTLLRRLADGEFHSGEALAKQLGISRASISNALSGVSDYGLTLHSVRGKGYRLANPPQWLDAACIRKHLGTADSRFHVEILDNAKSSNTLLMQRAAQGAPSGSVLAVEWQSGGRGRMGRSWHSSLGGSLTFSLLWRFDCGLANLSGLSLAAGVALVRALHALDIKDTSLKWPNDLLGSRGKLGGILIEAQGDMLGPSVIVAGIGLNLSMHEPVLRQIDQPVTCLAEMTAAVPERNLLLATILHELHQVLEIFSLRGFAAVRPDWEKHHSAQGRKVQLLLPGGDRVTGIACGVADDGSLKLETAQGIRLFNAGEVSLRNIRVAECC